MSRFNFNTFFHRHVLFYKNCNKQIQRRYSVDNIKTLLSKQEISNNEITIRGWVKGVRQYKELTFLHLNDGSGPQHLQVIVPLTVSANKEITFGSCVEVKGKLIESIGQGQKVELVSDSIDIIGPCNNLEFPFKAGRRHPASYSRDILHLRPKTNFFSALLRIRNAASMAVHNFFQAEDFVFIHTPVLTSSDCEGACEMFIAQPLKSDLLTSSDSENETDTEKDGEPKYFFRQPSYLTVSGQLHLEVMTGAFTKVYNFGPAFRAENSIGSFHLSEFYMIEAELAFIEIIEDLSTVMERLVKFTVQKTLDSCPEDVSLFQKFVATSKHKGILKNITECNYERMTYTDAINILKKSGKTFEYTPEWGCDLKKEHEMYLTKVVGDAPVFVTDYPAQLKPFYARRNNDGTTVSALDLLVPGIGELCGSSLREERADVLESVMKELNLLEQIPWYLELRKFGSCPHGGFGLGFERLLMATLGAESLKDVIPFPRWPRNCRT
ncbi:asparagine--tRNA ligase mitochondrial [Biomphalaria pfeifferi]|uniref:asparagine--tRNA ligase n=1 Tax=Biomphalaria pfeifferi TaxID=112525 RepID=A0AAD8BU23_BIOPF|nr:asparagine--tRNA ligase mitochondrial [Biomphalaria pfeifferi]